MPGGTVCAVAICKSNSKKAKENGSNIMFFTFPKDPAVRKKWVQKCYRQDRFKPENKRICSLHFEAEDYEDSLQARLTGQNPRRLRKTAIPSLNLLPSDRKSKVREATESPRTKRHKTRERKVLIENIIRDSDAAKSQTMAGAQDNTHNEHSENLQIPVSNRRLQSVLEKELELLRHENGKLKEEIETLKKNEESLKNIIFQLAEQLQKKSNKFVDNARVAFKDFLTSNQLDIVLKKKSKAQWTMEELSKAFVLRYFSKRCYLYVKETLRYPLPGLSTLQQWATSINLSNRNLEEVLRMVNTAGKIQISINQKDLDVVQALPAPNVQNGSSISSESISSVLSNKNISERDALLCIARDLAKRYLTKYPHLGEYAKNADEAISLHNYSIPQAQTLSPSDSFQPCAQWLDHINTMEKYFKEFHQGKLKRGKQILEKTRDYLQKHMPDIPRDLIQAFCLQRIFMEVKLLNETRKDTQIRKRTIPCDTNGNAVKKKKSS